MAIPPDIEACLLHASTGPAMFARRRLEPVRALKSKAGFAAVMLLLRRPSPTRIKDFLLAQRVSKFSYPEIGATKGELPPDYAIDRYGLDLGEGRAVFERAKSKLADWAMCRLGWVEVIPDSGPLRVGTNLAIIVRVFPFHYLNGGRVTVLGEEKIGSGTRFAIGYGTLLDHAEQGEEMFSVTWDHLTDRVRYDVVAFSRPRLLAARLARILTRRLQKRFARDNCRVMQDLIHV